MKEQLKKTPFSSNLFYTKDDDQNMTIFSSSGDKLGSFNYVFEPEIQELICSNQKILSSFNSNLEEEFIYALLTSASMLNAKKMEISPVNKIPICLEQIEKNDFINHIEFKENKVLVYFKLPKNTHYVQQANLRFFSTNPKQWNNPKKRKPKKARIFCYDIDQRKLLTRTNFEDEEHYGIRISTIAKQLNFYSTYLEDYLRHNIETPFVPIINKIVQKGSIENLTIQERIVISKFILTQYERTPIARKIFQETHTQSIHAFNKTFHNIDSSKYNIQYEQGYIRFAHEELLMNLINPDSEVYIVPKLLHYKWKLISAPSDFQFFTSDNPILLINPFERGKTDQERKADLENINRFMNSKGADSYVMIKTTYDGVTPGALGICIYFPLSPKFCLALMDTSPYKNIRFLNHQQINHGLVANSYKYIFSNDKLFPRISLYLKDHISLKERLKEVEVWGEKL